MKRLYALDARGKRKEWVFCFMAHPDHVEDWLRDGLPVTEVVNVIPEWVVDLGFARPWFWLQDMLGGPDA